MKLFEVQPGTALTWLGTAGFRLVSGDTTILVDPYLTRNEKATPVQDLRPADMADADFIFLSHGHFDHIADVPAIVEASGAKVYCSDVSAATLAKNGVPAANRETLSCQEELEFPGFTLETTTCPHIRFDAKLLLRTLPGLLPALPRVLPQVRGMPPGPVFIFTFRFADASIMHLGSLGLTPERVGEESLPSPDILLIPLQGHSDICRRAAELTRALNPRAVVPHHHDDFFPPVSASIDIEPFRQMVSMWLPECIYYEPQVNRPFNASDLFAKSAGKQR